MQKIMLESKNVPGNASQVPCSTSLPLNKQETVSVADGLKNDRLDTINPEVNQPEYTQGLKANKVYVVSIEGNPLMPCSCCKAKKLLRDKKAVVIKRFPFVIQLCFECENKVQKVTLGIDSGFTNIGFSAVSETKELISGTVKLDGKTSERLQERKLYRRGRRNKLWYREPRFLNRTKPEGWLPPSVQRRYATHLNLINRLKKILPISDVIIEVANFDVQKIMNPEISGTDYQQGNLYEYQNMRSYLMAREHGKCQLCGKDFKGQPSNIHHCKQRSESGSNKADNLALMHKACHEKFHKQGLKLPKPKSYKPNTFMSIIHKRFWKDVDDLQITYGYKTFIKRNELGLEKSHSTDAFVIADGTIHKRNNPTEVVQIHRNNRVLQLNRKWFKPSIKREKSKANPKDLFWVDGKQYVCKGMFGKGTYICYGDIKEKEYFRFSRVEKVFHNGGLAWN